MFTVAKNGGGFAVRACERATRAPDLAYGEDFIFADDEAVKSSF